METSVFKNDLSSPWVSESPDLAALNRSVPLTDFGTVLAQKNCDFEFSILEKITCTNRHFDYLVKPDTKTQSKNRYYHIRVFGHSVVQINGGCPRISDNEEDLITNMSVKSHSSALYDAFGGVGDSHVMPPVGGSLRKRFSNGTNEFRRDHDMTTSMEPVHKPYSSSQRMYADIAKEVSSKWGCGVNQGSFDLIEEASNEGSPVNLRPVGNASELFDMCPRKPSLDAKNDDEIAQGGPSKAIRKAKHADGSDLAEFPMNLDRHSDTNSISWMSECTYINASYIHHPYLADTDRPMIITQLPLPCTLADFWTMVWENSTPAIVMLCRYSETDGEGSRKYYPKEGSPLRSGRFLVALLDYKKGASVSTRLLKLTNTVSGVSVEVKHYKFKRWSDKENIKEEEYPQMAQLLRTLVTDRQLEQSDHSLHGPVVVHCKAGVGRSGVFAALFFIAEYLMAVEREAKASGFEVLERQGRAVSVFATVRKLRECRWGLVMTPKQYFNIYDLTQYMITNFLLKA